ncbi:MAG TPA: class I SAM-dependent methyltransferase [Candidatus Limnocylindria bacterium]|nr:class I SAM-dependent methyltransferase [Candidatus Limnocylindria bacterium]
MEPATGAAELRFGFGRNWRSFVDASLSEERVAEAERSLQALLRRDSLRGLVFVDIGCGSGLFSLAACRLDAARVVSFDFDPDSVATAEYVRQRYGIAVDRWQIARGSILDPKPIAGLGPADVVYSWGVLHHTGQMWKAIDNAVGLVKPGGALAISIYNNVQRMPDSSAMWWRIKRAYNRAGPVRRRLMEFAYVSNFVATRLVTLRNPFRAMADRSGGTGRRGMDFWHDVRDWLGGFPYEYATAGEVFNYVHERHGLALEYLRTQDGNVCNEFLFRKPGVETTPGSHGPTR